jgi:hypothetical protein
VAFSPDGSRIVANSAYGILSVFNAGPEAPKARTERHPAKPAGQELRPLD